jgi:hypothetical protein
MPKPLVHFLAAFPILILAGLACGALLGILAGAKSFALFIQSTAFGAWYCLLVHGPELSIATMIYCWIYHRRHPVR